MQLSKRLPIIFIVAFWSALGGLKLWFSLHGNFSPAQAIIGVNTLLFGFFLLHRREGDPSPYRWYVQGAIFLSVFLGYFFRYDYATPAAGTVLSVAGSALSIWALVSLGKAFGVAPVNRGLVVHGPYRYIRHPMYTGYLITGLPVLIWNSSVWNWTVYLILLASFAIRIALEERVVSDYDSYTQKVPWRIVPFIW